MHRSGKRVLGPEMQTGSSHCSAFCFFSMPQGEADAWAMRHAAWHVSAAAICLVPLSLAQVTWVLLPLEVLLQQCNIRPHAAGYARLQHPVSMLHACGKPLNLDVRR